MSEIDTNKIVCADCFDFLPTLPDNSIHAVVTDPPYGLAFMGKSWDDFEPKEYQEWCEKWAKEVLRVLKPGGHLLAFSGNRTHHRLFTGVEDAGFEVRDTLTWHYGSGFPKASDISKTIDKREGAEREIVGVDDDFLARNPKSDHADEYSGGPYKDGVEGAQVTEPATPEAEKWDGWKTGLKPATEYVVMARKPFDGATVDCVLEHGTGALNIDGTRIGTEADSDGRYPSNVVFDATEAERLDREVGTLSSGTVRDDHDVQADTAQNCYGEYGSRDAGDISTIGDSGGPSRYFYTSKASKSERTENGKIENSHPTVKPQDLMEWLIKLVTRENQIIIDPFCGSGTTCKAAKSLNREFIGTEQQAKWADVARVRIGLTPNDPSVVRENDNQEGLESYTD